MKTVSESDNNENKPLADDELTDFLNDDNNDKRGQSLLKCNAELAKSYNILKSTPMGHKGQFFEKVLSKNGVTQSMPNRLDEKNKLIEGGSVDVVDNCDTNSLLLNNGESPPGSPVQELWFKTWPERYEKIRTTEDKVTNGNSNGDVPEIPEKNCVNGKVSLNEALQSIQLAYSPVTKRLHLVEKNLSEPIVEEKVEDKKKLGHRRNEPGSFSSTVSSLSDPSPSGSLLDAEDRSSPTSDTGAKPKKKGFTNFFNRSVFNWKSGQSLTANVGPSSVWKLFSKVEVEGAPASSPQHQNVIVSSAALIQHNRPSNLPAKTLEEEQRHRDEYKAMLAAAKKKEAQNSAAKQRQQKLQLQLEEQQALSTRHFTQYVLPSWETMHNNKKTKDMWWLGLPSSVRGKVWRLAIGNDLNLTQQLYEICVTRAQQRLNSPEPPKNSDIDQESSMDVIQLDISRTFPSLCIFQDGGPYSDVLHSLLAAYVCYRPDVGYVQGMSYIAAILILNMEQFEAFVCFANLLNRPLHLAAFTLNQVQMHAYFNAYNEVFNYNLPKLYAHFECSGLTPDLYLLDWIYTIYAKAMPLDCACRVWDLFLRDGEEFIFRTALGILHLNQEVLMKMDFLHGAQFLTHLPEDLPVDQLFKSIQCVSTNVGKQTFLQIVDKYSANPSS